MPKTIETAAKHLDSLCGRWACEAEYEDWEDYRKSMADNLPDGATIETFTKRPFQVIYKLDGKRYFIRASATKITAGEII